MANSDGSDQHLDDMPLEDFLDMSDEFLEKHGLDSPRQKIDVICLLTEVVIRLGYEGEEPSDCLVSDIKKFLYYGGLYPE